MNLRCRVVSGVSRSAIKPAAPSTASFQSHLVAVLSADSVENDVLVQIPHPFLPLAHRIDIIGLCPGGSFPGLPSSNDSCWPLSLSLSPVCPCGWLPLHLQVLCLGYHSCPLFGPEADPSCFLRPCRRDHSLQSVPWRMYLLCPGGGHVLLHPCPSTGFGAFPWLSQRRRFRGSSMLNLQAPATLAALSPSSSAPHCHHPRPGTTRWRTDPW